MERTHERILKIGRAILLEQGLRALTTNSVARRARVSKTTLYRHFPTKEALLEQIVISFVEGQLAQWDAIFSSDASGIDRILQSLDFIGRFLPLIQSSLISQVEHVSPELWEKIDAIRMQRLIKLKKLFEEAQQEGYMRDDVDSEHWILLLTATIRSVLVPHVLLERGLSLLELVRTVQMIYYDGLLTERGRAYFDAENQRRSNDRRVST
jgi:AcrR family transcriptional regulator